MPRRTTPLVPDCYYHIYNRGHNGIDIFYEPENYAFFLRQFSRYVCGEHADVIAYALMPNHYHFFLEVRSFEFSHSMQNFSISYVKAINKRYKRSGTLYQGSFQAKIVAQNRYLLHLSRYIHLNPVSAGLVDQPEDWEYSSYRGYIGLREGTIPQPSIVLNQFQVPGKNGSKHYRSFVEDLQDENIITNLLFD